MYSSRLTAKEAANTILNKESIQSQYLRTKCFITPSGGSTISPSCISLWSELTTKLLSYLHQRIMYKILSTIPSNKVLWAQWSSPLLIYKYEAGLNIKPRAAKILTATCPNVLMKSHPRGSLPPYGGPKHFIKRVGGGGPCMYACTHTYFVLVTGVFATWFTSSQWILNKF